MEEQLPRGYSIGLKRRKDIGIDVCHEWFQVDWVDSFEISDLFDDFGQDRIRFGSSRPG